MYIFRLRALSEQVCGLESWVNQYQCHCKSHQLKRIWYGSKNNLALLCLPRKSKNSKYMYMRGRKKKNFEKTLFQRVEKVKTNQILVKKFKKYIWIGSNKVENIWTVSYDIVCFLYILRILLKILNQGRLFELRIYCDSGLVSWILWSRFRIVVLSYIYLSDSDR